MLGLLQIAVILGGIRVLEYRWPVEPVTDHAGVRTDVLYALIHRIVLELDWRAVCDLPFLKNDTNSPYLVGPNGWFLRDAASGKPLVWDKTAHSYPFKLQRAETPATTSAGHPAIEPIRRGPGWTAAAPAVQRQALPSDRILVS